MGKFFGSTEDAELKRNRSVEPISRPVSNYGVGATLLDKKNGIKN